MSTNIELIRFIANSKHHRQRRELLQDFWTDCGRPIFPRTVTFQDNLSGLDELFEYSDEETQWWKEQI
jgi:hypothetical protein